MALDHVRLKSAGLRSVNLLQSVLRGGDDWAVVPLSLGELDLGHVQFAVRVLPRGHLVGTGVVAAVAPGCAVLGPVMDLRLQLHNRGIQFL